MSLKCTTELVEKGILFEEILLKKAVHTVEDVEQACDCKKSEVIKTLLFMGNQPIVVVATGDKMVDLKKVKRIYSDKTLKMATPKEVKNITGFVVGTVGPVGLPAKLEVIADESLKDLKSLIVGSGVHNILLRISIDEFLKSFNGAFGDVTKE